MPLGQPVEGGEGMAPAPSAGSPPAVYQMALAGCQSPTLDARSCLLDALLIGLVTSAPSAKASRASASVIVDLKRLHALCMALVLSGSSGLPPLIRGMSSSMTVQSGSGHLASGFSGWPHRLQCVLVALMRRVSCLRRCTFRLVGFDDCPICVHPTPAC